MQNLHRLKAALAALTWLFATLGAADAQNETPGVPVVAAHESGTPPQDGTLVISDPQHVQDTTLRNGKYWGKWNFGNAPYLQIGVQPSTVYDLYRTVSLIRFDLAGSKSMQVNSAKLRLYIPRNQTQMVPVPIHVYSVTAANAAWREGSSEAEEEAEASSWNSSGKGRAWAGGPGLSMPGVDYAAQALDTKTADGLDSEWLEFELPKSLVQSWMENPDANAGLLIKTDDNAEPGQSTHICSSQHWSGKGPQLVVNGKILAANVPAGIHSETARQRPIATAPNRPALRALADRK